MDKLRKWNVTESGESRTGVEVDANLVSKEQAKVIYTRAEFKL